MKKAAIGGHDIYITRQAFNKKVQQHMKKCIIESFKITLEQRQRRK
jgi:hypothetical protein